MARRTGAEGIEAVIIDVETDFVCCLAKGKVEAVFNGWWQRKVCDVAAVCADYVMVMFRNVFS